MLLRPLLLPESLVAVILPLLAIAQCFSRAEAASMGNGSTLYRPAVHFTPEHGFMNDPNGLIWDAELGKFHMFYQYNPNSTIAGNQHWGHATSPDLLNWADEPIALGLDPHSGAAAFSGSAVWDGNNTSGLFAASSSSNLLAVFTRALPNLQYQAVAASTNHGQTFDVSSERTVLNLNLSQFRDPQVQWYAPESKWVMTVVLSREHTVAFYESKDLLHWEKMSGFSAGVLGVDYECPNLVEVPAGNSTKWVLFISINPGAPQGGSGTQYFVGDFDGQTFKPDSYAVNFVDFAKDNYALQVVNSASAPHSPATYIGWFGNWQYCQEAPTETWRGAMTLPRVISLAENVYGDLQLVQQPRGLEALRVAGERADYALQVGRANKTQANAPQTSARQTSARQTDKQNHTIQLPQNHTANEILIKGRIGPLNGSELPGSNRFYASLTNADGEELVLGFDVLSSQMWLDRSSLHGFKNPFYTGQFSAAVDPGATEFDWRVVLDASVIEVYALNGFAVASSVYYAEAPLTNLVFSMPQGGSAEVEVTVFPLRKSVDRETLLD